MLALETLVTAHAILGIRTAPLACCKLLLNAFGQFGLIATRYLETFTIVAPLPSVTAQIAVLGTQSSALEQVCPAANQSKGQPCCEACVTFSFTSTLPP